MGTQGLDPQVARADAARKADGLGLCDIRQVALLDLLPGHAFGTGPNHEILDAAVNARGPAGQLEPGDRDHPSEVDTQGVGMPVFLCRGVPRGVPIRPSIAINGLFRFPSRLVAAGGDLPIFAAAEFVGDGFERGGESVGIRDAGDVGVKRLGIPLDRLHFLFDLPLQRALALLLQASGFILEAAAVLDGERGQLGLIGGVLLGLPGKVGLEHDGQFRRQAVARDVRWNAAPGDIGGHQQPGGRRHSWQAAMETGPETRRPGR